MVVFKKKTDAVVSFEEANDVAINVVVKDVDGNVVEKLPDGKYRLPAGFIHLYSNRNRLCDTIRRFIDNNFRTSNR